jgi:fatty acid desaturase
VIAMSETKRPAVPGRTAATSASPLGEPMESAERAAARRQAERRRKLGADVVAYVVINAFLVGVWAVTGAGYFWPGWVLAGWGVLLVLTVFDVLVRRPVTDKDVDAELRRQQRR